MPVIIRDATQDDLPTLLSFEQGIISYERSFDRTLKPDPISYYDLAAFIDSPMANIVVAEKHGQIVGSGSVRIRESRPYASPVQHAYIGFLFVRDDHRGKGIIQKILDALTDWARAKKLHDLQLTVYPDNSSALRAYEKAGFRPFLLDMRKDLNDED